MTEKLVKRLLAKVREFNEKMNARQERTIAKMDASLEEMKVRRRETTVYLEATEAYLESKEPTPEVAEYQEIRKEEATVDSVGALEEWDGDRHLAVGRCRQPKKRTQGDGGSRRKLAATRRRMTRQAVPEQCKGYGRQRPGKNDAVHKTPKRRTFEKR
jgi:hypothetical protein